MAQAVAIVGIWVGVGATAFAPSIGEHLVEVAFFGAVATAIVGFLME